MWILYAFKQIYHSVLIETYWNVNSFTLLFSLFFSIGLNRNILECKSGEHTAGETSGKVLIETYWNVN